MMVQSKMPVVNFRLNIIIQSQYNSFLAIWSICLTDEWITIDADLIRNNNRIIEQLKN